MLDAAYQSTEALDEGYEIPAIFLDYRKAFNTVPHRRLISKLKGYGVKRTAPSMDIELFKKPKNESYIK